MSGDNPLRACPKIELAMVPSRGISFAWGRKEKDVRKDKEKERKGKEKRRKRKGKGLDA